MGNPGSGSQGKTRTGKDVAERAVQLLTLVGALIGLPLAVAKGRPASVLVFALIVVAGLAIAATHLWRSRLPTGMRKYQWQRWAAVAALAAVAAGLSVIGAIPASRHFMIYSVLGFRSHIQPDVITIAESSSYYRIQIPIANTGAEDQQLVDQTITVSWGNQFAGLTAGCAGVPVVYRLDSRLRVTNHSATGTVHILAGGLSGFRLPVTGSFTDNCANGSLVLSFKPGLSLPKNFTTFLYVDVPKHMHAYKDDGYSADISAAPRQLQQTQVNVGIPRLKVGTKVPPFYYIAVRSTSKTSSGNTISGCEEIVGGSKAKLRVTNCRSATLPGL